MTQSSKIRPVNPERLAELMPAEAMQHIRVWQDKFPEDRKRPPIIPALKIVQDHHQNSLTDELMDAVADYLDVPRIAVYEVATFYTMFHLKPMGKHVISLCTNISCMLNGCESIRAHLNKRLGIDLGQTTADGQFSLKEVECLGACGGAPMLEVAEQYHEHLTPEKVDRLLAQLGWREEAKA